MIFPAKLLQKGNKMIRSGKSNHPLRLEKVPHTDTSSFVLETSKGKVLACNYHYHPELELTFIVSGSGRVLIGSTLTAFRPGDLALIGGNVPHLYASTLGPAASEQCSETRVLKFGNNLCDGGLSALPEFAVLSRLRQEAATGVLFRNNPAFQADFDQLAGLSGGKRLLCFFDLLLRLAVFPREVLPSSGNPVGLRPDDGGEQIERAIRFLQRHFREKITLADVAMATGMEPESFRRFFRRTVRVNVTDYLLELRLGYAEKLLQDTAGSISAIALEAGFRNLSNFNRLFRARRGITPRAYRKFSS